LRQSRLRMRFNRVRFHAKARSREVKTLVYFSLVVPRSRAGRSTVEGGPLGPACGRSGARVGQVIMWKISCMILGLANIFFHTYKIELGLALASTPAP
jgi:hypothetical protein